MTSDMVVIKRMRELQDQVADLDLRLGIATETNADDRRRLAEMEAVLEVVAQAEEDDLVGRLKVMGLRGTNWYLRDAARALLSRSSPPNSPHENGA